MIWIDFLPNKKLIKVLFASHLVNKEINKQIDDSNDLIKAWRKKKIACFFWGFQKFFKWIN